MIFIYHRNYREDKERKRRRKKRHRTQTETDQMTSTSPLVTEKTLTSSSSEPSTFLFLIKDFAFLSQLFVVLSSSVNPEERLY